MGLGWLQHTGHRTQRAECTGSGADLQLVELVGQACKSEESNGGDHESSEATERGWQADQLSRPKQDLADGDACVGGADQATRDQCAQRHSAYFCSLAAVDGLAKMGRHGAIHRGSNTGRAIQNHTDASCLAERLTEESRLKAARRPQKWATCGRRCEARGSSRSIA